jgi:hypothetical protein
LSHNSSTSQTYGSVFGVKRGSGTYGNFLNPIKETKLVLKKAEITKIAQDEAQVLPKNMNKTRQQNKEISLFVENSLEIVASPER